MALLNGGGGLTGTSVPGGAPFVFKPQPGKARNNSGQSRPAVDFEE